MNRILTILINLIFIASSCRSLRKKSTSDFVPQDYVLYEKLYGDLNINGQEDCILIIKGNDENNNVVNRFEKIVDRNRRGIIILLNNKGNYQVATKNYNCFYSENEDGGNYYAPQLSFEVIKGDLIIHFEHGRYGFWSYTFRLLNANFKLIKYQSSSNYGPIVNRETYINFLTKVKLIKENINEDDEGNDEVFKDTTSSIKIDTLIKLSEIKDFEELDMSIY